MKSKYDNLKAHYNQLEKDRDKQASLYSDEVAKREDAEQQLARIKSDLAALQAEHDGFQIVVCTCALANVSTLLVCGACTLLCDGQCMELDFKIMCSA